MRCSYKGIMGSWKDTHVVRLPLSRASYPKHQTQQCVPRNKQEPCNVLEEVTETQNYVLANLLGRLTEHPSKDRNWKSQPMCKQDMIQSLLFYS